jgi:hypothetical protein
LGGYGGEPWRKRYLLRLEGHDRCAEPQSSMSLFGARSPVETAGE